MRLKQFWRCCTSNTSANVDPRPCLVCILYVEVTLMRWQFLMSNLISLSRIRLHCPKFKFSKFGQFMAIVFTTLSSSCMQLLRFKFCKNCKFRFLNNNVNPLAVTLMLFDKFKVVNWCNFEMGPIPVFFCKWLAPSIPNSFKFWQMSKFLNHRWRTYPPS